MRNLQKMLAKFKDSNPISLLYEFGMSPDDMKVLIINSFNIYFENIDNLKRYAVSDLVGNWISYMSICKDHPDLKCNIKIVLDIFNDAKRVNESQTIESYLKWLPELNQSISRFWSLYNTQSAIFELGIEDFSAEAFRIIGQTIEGLSKPFLKLLLQLNRIRRKKSFDFLDIQSRDLGVIIDELINTTELKDLLIIQPRNIRLNQWRNIAYHHNSKIINGRIFVVLNRNGVTEEFEISRIDLFDALKAILAIFKLIRIAEIVFCIDNIQKIQEDSKIDKSELNIREESRLLDFHSTLSSQGFSMIDLKYDADLARLDLRDMEEYGHFLKRAIHSSQFLYSLWLFTQSNKLIVNYFLYDGDKFFTSEIGSESFDQHSEAEKEISQLLSGVKFTFVSAESLQNRDPFEEFELSVDAKNHPQKFYSQENEEISIETFAKKFILSIFCNYIALRSEQFKDIKINIGGDGSLVRTDGPKSLLFHVPATIRSKSFQIELIKLLDTTLDLYEKKALKLEIVSEARENNGYYQKKAIIRQQLEEIE